MKDLIKELEARDQKLAELESKLAELESQLAELVKENARLRELLEGKAKAKASRKPRFSDNYGGRSEQSRSKKKGRGKGATGRRPSGDKQYRHRIAFWFVPSVLGALLRVERFIFATRFLITLSPHKRRCRLG